MNRLIKPQKQSYTGEESQVVAYSLACEIAWTTRICTLRIGLELLYSSSPLAAAVGFVCVVTYYYSTAACLGLI